MSEHKSNESQPQTTADERERFNRVATLVRDELIIPYHLPSHPRTVRVDPKTLVAAWPLEPGDELIVKNESGVKIEVEAGMLSHGRVERINELVKERDAMRALLRKVEWSGCYIDAYGSNRRACPICHGIRPGEVMVSDYAKSIIGHRADCNLAAAITEPESEAGE